jgi:hypothetical protein
MSETIGKAQTYDDLIAACRERVQALGITYDILDLMAGFTVGYASKLFTRSEFCASGKRSSKRFLNPPVFDAYLAALGIELTLIENPARVAQLKKRMETQLLKRAGPMRTAGMHSTIQFQLTRRHMHLLARMAAKARSKIPARKRRAIARRAAKARWRQEVGAAPVTSRAPAPATPV